MATNDAGLFRGTHDLCPRVLSLSLISIHGHADSSQLPGANQFPTRFSPLACCAACSGIGFRVGSPIAGFSCAPSMRSASHNALYISSSSTGQLGPPLTASPANGAAYTVCTFGQAQLSVRDCSKKPVSYLRARIEILCARMNVGVGHPLGWMCWPLHKGPTVHPAAKVTWNDVVLL